MAGTDLTVFVDRETVEHLKQRVEWLEKVVEVLVQSEVQKLPPGQRQHVRIEIDPRQVSPVANQRVEKL